MQETGGAEGMNSDEDKFNQIPDEVWSGWVKECSCCPICSPSPCDGVMAGGLCDQICHCDDEDYIDEDRE